MKKHTILANIGNRNIKYLNQGYSNDEIPKGAFYTKTKFIWENQNELANVTPQILPAILREYPNSNLIIFTSNQSPPFSQDTYYEGLILEEILKLDFPNVQTTAIEMDGINPTNEDDLIQWFKSKIGYLIHIYPDSEFIVYNTGGTTQQKNALKTIVEFYLKQQITTEKKKKEVYRLFQGIEDKNGGTTIEEIKRTATEKLNQLINVKLLITHFNYTGALQLGTDILNKNANKILEYTSLRWNGRWDIIDRQFHRDTFNKALKSKKEFNVIDEADIKNLRKGESIFLNLVPKYFRNCKTLISKAYNQQLIADYTGSILTFHQFIESFILAFVESNSEFKVASNYREMGKSLILYLNENDGKSMIKLFGEKLTFVTFPSILFFAIKLTKNYFQSYLSLFESIKETQSIFKSSKYSEGKMLDSLRNAVAHKGKGVSEETFTTYKPLMEECYKNFVNHNDPFQVLNNFIEDLII